MTMNDDLLHKWLNDSLSDKEKKKFEQSDDYSKYVRIVDTAKYFKAPQYNQEIEFKELDPEKNSKVRSVKSSILLLAASIAAVLLIGFIIVKSIYTDTENRFYETSVAQTGSINLPDFSRATLNANTTLSYDISDWTSDRHLSLDGEALFDVKKGNTFTVKTSHGNVQVLGTVFNVKSREYSFEVACFEGSVKVRRSGSEYILKAHDRLVFTEGRGHLIPIEASLPDWKTKKSVFKSQPLGQVLQEFKNYYDFEIDTSNIDTSVIYSGSFTHEDLQIALNSITLPLGLTYRFNGKIIILSHR